jgi:hypothetical protein
MAEQKSKKLSPFERFVRAIAGVPKDEMREAELAEKRAQSQAKPKPKSA